MCACDHLWSTEQTQHQQQQKKEAISLVHSVRWSLLAIMIQCHVRHTCPAPFHTRNEWSRQIKRNEICSEKRLPIVCVCVWSVSELLSNVCEFLLFLNNGSRPFWKNVCNVWCAWMSVMRSNALLDNHHVNLDENMSSDPSACTNYKYTTNLEHFSYFLLFFCIHRRLDRYVPASSVALNHA